MSWGTIGGREELAGGTRRPLRLRPKQLQEAGLVCLGPRFFRGRPAPGRSRASGFSFRF